VATGGFVASIWSKPCSCSICAEAPHRGKTNSCTATRVVDLGTFAIWCGIVTGQLVCLQVAEMDLLRSRPPAWRSSTHQQYRYAHLKIFTLIENDIPRVHTARTDHPPRPHDQISTRPDCGRPRYLFRVASPEQEQIRPEDTVDSFSEQRTKFAPNAKLVRFGNAQPGCALSSPRANRNATRLTRSS
jgi:hypothetical protein